MIATTVPEYSCKNLSSQSTLSASKWFVGSSRSNKSGRLNKSLHNATRRRSPPESFVTSLSLGGQRNASIAISTLRSRLHASAALIFASSFACSAPTLSKSASGSAHIAVTFSYSANKSRIGATPSMTLPRTSFAGSSFGSCSRRPTEKLGVRRASPVNSSSRPAMILSKLDFPLPFDPRTPILAPG
ncbi:unannotated protein [freshwater metagenome]|uniref:Unannotated protein n=1 Tax=freshwater metagenome TaxID=449393 RepID=A0A6J7UF98_9ZZZZ